MPIASAGVQSEIPSTVYVVDDDEAVRDSIRWLLEASDYKVELFESGESFIANFDPEKLAVLLLDVRMTGMSGLEVQQHLLNRGVNIPILFITGHGDVPMAVNALKNGAVDFIEKPFDGDNLKALVDSMIQTARSSREENEKKAYAKKLLAMLTPRELDVLNRIVAGRLNKQIADDLSISIKTVEAHRASIMTKTRARTVADLMRVLIEAGETAAFEVKDAA